MLACSALANTGDLSSKDPRQQSNPLRFQPFDTPRRAARILDSGTRLRNGREVCYARARVLLCGGGPQACASRESNVGRPVLWLVDKHHLFGSAPPGIQDQPKWGATGGSFGPPVPMPLRPRTGHWRATGFMSRPRWPGPASGTRCRLLVGITLLLTIAANSPLLAAEDGAALLTQARTHLAKGRYEEALEVFERAGKAKADPVAVAIGESQAQQATGAWEKAEKTIDAALGPAPQDVRLLARRSELHLLRGRLAEAEKVAESARREDRENLLARLVLADVYAETGRTDEANEAYRWFIRYYNERQPEDAASLLWVAEGAIQVRLRWQRQRADFSLRGQHALHRRRSRTMPTPGGAPARRQSALGEIQSRAGGPRVGAGADLNPRAAEAIVLLGQDALDENDAAKAQAKADEALKIYPRLPAALRLKANAFWSTGRIGQANTAAERGPGRQSPRSARTRHRGRLRSRRRGPAAAGRVGKVAAQAGRDPPRETTGCGSFCRPLDGGCRVEPEAGRVLERSGRAARIAVSLRRGRSLLSAGGRRHAAASRGQKRAGHAAMRIGKLDEAHTMLDEAFQADPFHMRVSNFRKVLKLLDGYQTITTDHFVIRVDSQLDKLLGGYMAEYLEEIYPQLVAQFGFAPPQRTQFEVFNKSGGTSGHEWFSADGRHALDPDDRRVDRRDGGDGLAHVSPHSVQLGPRAAARVRARDHRAADGLQHSALVHRGAGRAE